MGGSKNSDFKIMIVAWHPLTCVFFYLRIWAAAQQFKQV